MSAVILAPQHVSEAKRVVAVPSVNSRGRAIPDGFEVVTDPQVDDIVYISAFGRWRRGVVVKTARVNITVAFVTPADLHNVRTANVRRELVATPKES